VFGRGGGCHTSATVKPHVSRPTLGKYCTQFLLLNNNNNKLSFSDFSLTPVGLYTHTRARSIFFSYPFSNFPAYIYTHTRPTFLCVAIIRCCYTIALAGWPLLSSAPSSSPSFCLPYKYRINTSGRRLSTHTSDAQPHAFRFIYIIMGYKHQSGLYMSLRFPV
jgi:hypothetical protein